MKRREPLEADGFVELSEGALVAFVRSEIITRGKSVLGVEANAQAVAFAGGVDDLCDLLETVAEIAALARGDFQSNPDAISRAGPVRFAQGFCNGLDARQLAGADVRARVRDQVAHAEDFAALQLVD